MRLICPNCGAQYEVDAAMIPAEGRDVQCSNCVTTWFQPGTQDADIGATSPPAQDVRTETPPPPPEFRTPRRRETSEEALEIIRQEAAREARMRQAEALETQEEMPLDVPDDAVERGRQARAQIADLKRPVPDADDDQARTQADADGMDAPFDPDGPLPGAEFDPDFDKDDIAEGDRGLAPAPQPPRGGSSVAQEAPPASRRDRLPDIEEINSTLSPDDGAQDGDAVVASPAAARAARTSMGRKLGFSLVVIIAIAAIGAYVSAGSLAQALPDAAPAVAAYVEWVNTLRMALHDLFEGFALHLDSMSRN